MKLKKCSIELMNEYDYKNMMQLVEKAGRICYKSECNISNESAEEFIRRIIKMKHESVLEHQNISVKVICDRGVSHEIVRHRIASYSQESTRYCNYCNDKFGNEISVIDLSSGFNYNMSQQKDVDKYNEWCKAMEDSERHYINMIKLGATPQEARSVLPNSLKTEIVITMNIREWRHFFRLRCDKKAHPQMREVSELILLEFVEKFSVFFEDIYKELEELK